MPIQNQEVRSNIDKLYQLFQSPVNPVAVKLAYGVDSVLRDVKITKVGDNYKVDWRPRKPSDPTRSFEIDRNGTVTSVGGKDASSQKMIEAINAYSRTIDSQNFQNLDILFKDLDSGSKIQVPFTNPAVVAQTHYEITLTISPDRTVRYDFQEIPNNPASTVGFSILRDASRQYKIQNVGPGLRATDLPGRVANAWQTIKNRIFPNQRVAALSPALNLSNSIQLPFLQSLMQDVQTSSHSVAVDRASIGGNDRIKQLFDEAKEALLGKRNDDEFFVVGPATPRAVNEISITKIASDRRDQTATKIKFKYHDGNGVVEFDVEMTDGKYLVSGVNAAHDPNFTNPVKAIRDLMTGSGNPLNLTEKINKKRLSDETLKDEQKKIFGEISKFLEKYQNDTNLDLGDNHRVQKINSTQFRIVLSGAANDSITVTKNLDGSYTYTSNKQENRSNPSLFKDQLSAINGKFSILKTCKDIAYDQLADYEVSDELQAVILGEKKLELAKRFLQVNEKVADAGYTDYQDSRTQKRVYVEEDGDNLVFRAIKLTGPIIQGEKNLSSLRELQALDTKLRSEIEQKIQATQAASLRGRDPDPLIELATAVFNANNDQRAGAVRAVEGHYLEILGQIDDAQAGIEQNQEEISKNSVLQRQIELRIRAVAGEIERQEQQQLRLQSGRLREESRLESRGLFAAGEYSLWPTTTGTAGVIGDAWSRPARSLDPLQAQRQQLQTLQAELATLRQGKAELERAQKAQKAALAQLRESLERIGEVFDLLKKLQKVNVEASRIRGGGASIAEKIDAEQGALDPLIVAQKQHASARNFKLNTRNFEIKHVQGQADAPANINRDFDAQDGISEYLRIADAISPQRAVAPSFAASRGNEAAPRGHDAVEFSAAADPRAATTEFRGHGAASREYGAAYYRGHVEESSFADPRAAAAPRDPEFRAAADPRAATQFSQRGAPSYGQRGAPSYGQSAATSYGGSRFSSAATPPYGDRRFATAAAQFSQRGATSYGQSATSSRFADTRAATYHSDELADARPSPVVEPTAHRAHESASQTTTPGRGGRS